MPERKPSHQSWESFAEQQIRAAQESGEFDRLPGQGQPIPGIDEPADENWWVKRKLREERASILPPLLEARRDIEQTRAQILAIHSEEQVRAQLLALQGRVWAAITSPLLSPPVVVFPVDIEEELARWREGQSAG